MTRVPDKTFQLQWAPRNGFWFVEVKLKTSQLQNRPYAVSFWADPDETAQSIEYTKKCHAEIMESFFANHTSSGSLREHIALCAELFDKPLAEKLAMVDQWPVWPEEVQIVWINAGHMLRHEKQFPSAWHMYATAIMHSTDKNAKHALFGNMDGVTGELGGSRLAAEALVGIAVTFAINDENIQTVIDLCKTALQIYPPTLCLVYHARAVVYANGTVETSMRFCSEVLIPFYFRCIIEKFTNFGTGASLIEFEMSIWPVCMRKPAFSGVVDCNEDYESFIDDVVKLLDLEWDQGVVTSEHFAIVKKLLRNVVGRESVMRMELIDYAESDHRCALCNKAFLRLQRCSLCRKAAYCCKQHQAEDWKEHKLVCDKK